MSDVAEERTDDLAEFRGEWNDVIARAIARAWIDDEFKAQLIADPTPYLHGEGLMFPTRYVVEFYDDPAAHLGEWHSVGRGSTAVHRFPIPPRPDALATSDDALGLDASTLACCCPCASCCGAISNETWA
jgi:hypothetical protein